MVACGCARTSPAHAVPIRSEQDEVLGAQEGVKGLPEALQQHLRDCPTGAGELKLQAGCEWGSGGGWGHPWLKQGQHALDVTPHCGAGLLAVRQQQRAPSAQGKRGGVMLSPAKPPAQLSPSVGLHTGPGCT